jgi:hypothetical protein
MEDSSLRIGSNCFSSLLSPKRSFPLYCSNFYNILLYTPSPNQVCFLFFSSEKHWTRFWDPQYGNCFAFNSHLGGSNVNRTFFRANKPGSAYGKLQWVVSIPI